MPQMNPDILQLFNDWSNLDDIDNLVSSATNSLSRGGRGGGSGGSGYSVPQLAREYVGQEQASAEATDDGQNGPVAAKSHAMAYMEDPQWQHWDKMRSGAVNNMKGGGGFWGWATGGRYNNALGQEAQYADYMARQIEKRYLDEATVRAANTDRYDWTKPSRQAVYNPETGTYADEFTGTLGGKAMRPVDRPTQDMVNEYGESVTATKGPANQGWVTQGARPALAEPTKYINGSTEPPAEGPFAGGEADVEAAMPVVRSAKVLADNAKAASEVKRDEAAADKDAVEKKLKEAELKMAGVNIPAGATRAFASGQKYTAPQTGSQSGANRGGGGAGRPLSVTAKLEQARKNALSAVPKNKEMEWNAAKLAEWQKAYDAKVAEELELIERMDSGAPSVGDAEPDNDYGGRRAASPKAAPQTSPKLRRDNLLEKKQVSLKRDMGGYKKDDVVEIAIYKDGSSDILRKIR